MKQGNVFKSRQNSINMSIAPFLPNSADRQMLLTQEFKWYKYEIAKLLSVLYTATGGSRGMESGCLCWSRVIGFVAGRLIEAM